MGLALNDEGQRSRSSFLASFFGSNNAIAVEQIEKVDVLEKTENCNEGPTFLPLYLFATLQNFRKKSLTIQLA